MTASSTYALGEWQGFRSDHTPGITRSRRKPTGTTSDRIGEGNNQRNEREHHSKSALLLASFHICRKIVPIPKVPLLKTKIQSYADSAPLVDYHGSR